MPRPPSVPDGEPEALFDLYRTDGDDAAFASLYDMFERKLFATAVRFFRAAHADGTARTMACDAVQETWMRVVRRRAQWEAHRGSFMSWLMTIHFHCLVDMSRRAPSRDSPDDGCERFATTAPDPERRFLAVELLNRALKRLAEDEAAVLLTYYLVNDTRMVCASLCISAQTLRKRVERLKVKLKGDRELDDVLREFGADE